MKFDTMPVMDAQGSAPPPALTETTTRPHRPRLIAAIIAGATLLVTAVVTGIVAMTRTGGSPHEASIFPTVTVSPSATTSKKSPSPTPTPAAFDIAALQVPTIESMLPQMPRADIGALGELPEKVAIPTNDRTPVWKKPDASIKPALALAAVQYDADARWLVLDTTEDWVQVLLPYGRGALPSQDPARVNGISGWVRAEDVRLKQENQSVLIDLSDRTVTVATGEEKVTVAAGIGAPATPTPQGISQVMTVTTASNTGLTVFLSMQSESLDTFAGVPYAATALHKGVGQGQEVSNGCIRLTAEGFEVVRDLPAGVPVLVRE